MSGRRKKRPPSLSQEDIAHLNTQFYQFYPFEELGVQLSASLLLLNPREELRELLTTNIDIGGLHVRLDETSDDDLRQAAAFAVISSSHHIAETLVRLLYVHASHAPCPWLGLVRLRERDALHRIAEDLRRGQIEANGEKRDLFQVVADVCFGAAVARDEMTEEQVEMVSNSVSWVQYAAELADESSVYNAYKHGVGVVHQRPLPLALSVGDRRWSDSMEPFLSFVRPSCGQERARCDYVMEHKPLNTSKRAAASVVMLILVESILAHGARERRAPTKAKPKLLKSDFTPESAHRKPSSPFEVVRDADEYGGPPAIAAKRPTRDIMKLWVRRRPEAIDDADSQGSVTIHVDPDASKLR